MAGSAQREWESSEDDYQSSRKDAIRADISRRLKKICSHLPDDEFNDLVDVMAENKMKGDLRTTL